MILRKFVNALIICPIYNEVNVTLFFFNSHSGSNIPTNPGLNISTEVEIFAPWFKYSDPGLNISTKVEIFTPCFKYVTFLSGLHLHTGSSDSMYAEVCND